jgi:hypothetical protein
MQMLFGYSSPKGTRTTDPVNRHTQSFSVYDAMFQFVSDKELTIGWTRQKTKLLFSQFFKRSKLCHSHTNEDPIKTGKIFKSLKKKMGGS